jgi:hypothetical protein
VKVGDLVKTTRFSIGVPYGAVGLIVGVKELEWADNNPFVIDFLKETVHGERQYVVFPEDLEVVNECG